MLLKGPFLDPSGAGELPPVIVERHMWVSHIFTYHGGSSQVSPRYVPGDWTWFHCHWISLLWPQTSLSWCLYRTEGCTPAKKTGRELWRSLGHLSLLLVCWSLSEGFSCSNVTLQRVVLCKSTPKLDKRNFYFV